MLNIDDGDEYTTTVLPFHDSCKSLFLYFISFCSGVIYMAVCYYRLITRCAVK